jgi:hypothetical protein
VVHLTVGFGSRPSFPVYAESDQGPLHITAVGRATRDSSNLIGGEPKFVHSAFTLEPTVNRQGPPKCLFGSTFREFWHQKFVRWRKTYPQYLWKPKLLSSKQTFLSKLIKSLQFIYFNGFLPCPLEGSLSEVLLTPQS